MKNKVYDVIIVGGGVVGTAIARELTKYKLKIALLEKNSDVGEGTSKANDGVVHTGFDATPHTLQAKLVVQSSFIYPKLCSELNVPYRKVGALLVVFEKEQIPTILQLKKNAEINGIRDLNLLSREEIFKVEPNLNTDVLKGLMIPRESITCPFTLTIAYAENALQNGAEIFLENQVKKIEIIKKSFKISTNQHTFYSKFIINSAGLFSDEISMMVGINNFRVIPRKGEFIIFDEETKNIINRIILPVPTKITKGILITPTIHGNVLMGPTAKDITDKTDFSVTREGIKEIITKCTKVVPILSKQTIISQYAGLRASTKNNDYIIESNDKVPRFLNIASIRSTGLTSSPMIAKYAVEKLVEMGLKLIENKDFNPYRELPYYYHSQDIVKEIKRKFPINKKFGHIVCRCNKVSEQDIIEAIHSPLGARTLDGIKRRTWAGAGRCQGSFCETRIIKILARELGIDIAKISRKGKGSEIAISRNKETLLIANKKNKNN